MGTSRGLRNFKSDIKCYAIEPAESLHGLEGLKHMESSIIPGIYKEEELDGIISLPKEESYDRVETLEKEEGILVGHSSAAAMLGALKLASKIESGVIVTVFPPTALPLTLELDSYKSTVTVLDDGPVPTAVIALTRY